MRIVIESITVGEAYMKLGLDSQMIQNMSKKSFGTLTNLRMAIA